MSSTKKILLLCVGCISLALGLVGVFAPVIPTTPFILLAALCFSKSSERFHAWIIRHKLFGPIVEDWQKKRAIAPKAKLLASSMLVLSAITLFFFLNTLAWVKMLILVFLVILLVFILSRPNGTRL